MLPRQTQKSYRQTTKRNQGIRRIPSQREEKRDEYEVKIKKRELWTTFFERETLSFYRTIGGLAFTLPTFTYFAGDSSN